MAESKRHSYKFHTNLNKKFKLQGESFDNIGLTSSLPHIVLTKRANVRIFTKIIFLPKFKKVVFEES